MKKMNNSTQNYYPEIDFIKTFAIISVIILHMLTYESNTILYNSFASFYIWQAVPLFMLVFGFTFRLSMEKQQTISEIILSRLIRLLIPLFISYILSFILLFLFKITPEISWHSIIGKLPLYGNGTYFITLYLETLIYFFILYYIVKKYNKYFVILFSICISIIGELILYNINITDSFMNSASVHRYALVITLGYYLYDYLQNKMDNLLTLILGSGSAFLLYIHTINMDLYYDTPWWDQEFIYAFYTVVFALILIHLYKITNSIFITKLIKIISKSTLHIFLLQIFIFNLRKFYTFEITILYGILILFGTLLMGIIWYKIEDLLLKSAQLNKEVK